METRRARMLAAHDVRQLARRLPDLQHRVEHHAHDRSLDVIRLGGVGRHFRDTVAVSLLARKQMQRP